MERKESLLERAAQALEMPVDAVAGLMRLELLGDRELRMEAHKGILAYGTTEIHVSGGMVVVRMRGEGLELRSMNPTDLFITGRISSLDFT